MRVFMVGGSPAGVSVDTLRRAAAGTRSGADAESEAGIAATPSASAALGTDAVAGARRHGWAVVAVDRGLDALLAAGIEPDLFCGDADSVSADGRALVERVEAASDGSAASGFEVERYDPHKDFTDLSLALRAVKERWGGADLVISGFSGGNPDHYLGVLGRLAAWDGRIELAEEGFRGRVLHAGESWSPLMDEKGLSLGDDRRLHRFSFIPIAPEGAVVSEVGMRWELERARVELLSDLGISNVVEDPSARIACHEGCLICWLFG